MPVEMATIQAAFPHCPVGDEARLAASALPELADFGGVRLKQILPTLGGDPWTSNQMVFIDWNGKKLMAHQSGASKTPSDEMHRRPQGDP